MLAVCCTPHLSLLPGLGRIPSFNTLFSLEKRDKTKKTKKLRSFWVWGVPGWEGCVSTLLTLHAFSQGFWWTTVRYTAEPSTPARLVCLWPQCASRLWDRVKRDCASIIMQAKQRQSYRDRALQDIPEDFLEMDLGKNEHKVPVVLEPVWQAFVEHLPLCSLVCWGKVGDKGHSGLEGLTTLPTLKKTF